MGRVALIVYIDEKDKATLETAAKDDDRKVSPFCRRILEAKARELRGE